MRHSKKDGRMMDIRTIGVCILTFYYALSFVFSDFSISAVWGALFFCGCAGISLLQFAGSKEWKGKPWQLVDGLLLVFAGTVFINILRNQVISRIIIYYFLILMGALILFWTRGTSSDRTIQIAKGALVAIACFFSAVNLLHFFSPEFVEQKAFMIISETSRVYVERLFGEGYGFAFGEDIGYTAGAIAMGIGVLCMGMTVENWKTRVPVQMLLCLALLILQRRGELLIGVIAWLLVSVIRIICDCRIVQTHQQRKSVFFVVAIQLMCIVVSAMLFFSFDKANRLTQTVTLVQDVQQNVQQAEEEERYHGEEEVSFNNQLSVVEVNENTVDNTVQNDQQENTETEKQREEAIEELGNGRIILWKLAWDSFLESPIFGHGWGSFAQVAPQSGNTHATNAHCVYLQLLCEVGVVGFALFGCVFIWILCLVVKRLWACRNVTAMNHYYFALYVLLFMLGNGTIDNSLYYPTWILLFVFAMMLVFQREKQKAG